MPAYARCADCARTMRNITWPKETGDVVHHAHGLCRTCSERARLGKTTGQPARVAMQCGCGRTIRGLPGETPTCWVCRERAAIVARARRRESRIPRLVEDFYFIAADSGERDLSTIGYTTASVRIIADRMGVKHKTLQSALYRHVRRSNNTTCV